MTRRLPEEITIDRNTIESIIGIEFRNLFWQMSSTFGNICQRRSWTTCIVQIRSEWRRRRRRKRQQAIGNVLEFGKAQIGKRIFKQFPQLQRIQIQLATKNQPVGQLFENASMNVCHRNAVQGQQFYQRLALRCDFLVQTVRFLEVDDDLLRICCFWRQWYLDFSSSFSAY